MSIEDAVAKIRSMEIRGAGRIARFAVSSVKELVINSKAVDVKQLQDETLDALRRLNSSRPTAVSLLNGLRYVYLHSMKQTRDDETDLASFKNSIITACEDFINKSEGALPAIAGLGAGKIDDGFTIQTHCNSHMALGVIMEAHKQGKRVRVYASESRPWHQGRLTVRELAAENVPVTLIVDSAVRYFMDKVDAVFVGADTITANGDLINKIGTAQVALAAEDAGVPFYVCAETYKFSPETLNDPDRKIVIEERDSREVLPDLENYPGVNIANPVFDRTPARLIKEFITETGIVQPENVDKLIMKEFGSGEQITFID